MATGRSAGTRKSAILLLSMGEDAAAEVLKLLDEDEVRAITAQMPQFQDVTLTDVDRVANEYFVRHDRDAGSIKTPETKLQYLGRVLSKALGESRSGEIVEGILNRPRLAPQRDQSTPKCDPRTGRKGCVFATSDREQAPHRETRQMPTSWEADRPLPAAS